MARLGAEPPAAATPLDALPAAGAASAALAGAAVEVLEGAAAPSSGQKKCAVAMTVWCPKVTWNFALVVTDCLKYDRRLTAHMQASMVGTGNFSPMTMPRSNSLASSAATHIATRSPWIASVTGCLNICKLLTFLALPASPRDGTLTMCWGLMEPERTVPVRTVPWPLMGNAWSKENMKGPVGSRRGMSSLDLMSSTKASTPMGGVPSPCGFAEMHAKGKVAPNFVAAKVACSFLMTDFNDFSRFASGIMSILFRMMISWLARISATTRHSAVWAWMPLLTSMTSAHRSMIWAPPMTVRISEA
mmetsp:Transcript_120041/g.345100  ORF Transcript_120041/g.345100 Transcript_120041/m.345100 type:complete len:303 (-) Transcript_120041:308-1216(-)